MQTLQKVHTAPPPEAIAQYYEAMRPFWHPVMATRDLTPGKPQVAELLGEPLVLARLNGQIVVMEDVCRHFQARLSLGEVREITGHGECLMCPYHGWSYAENGQCVYIPQLAKGRDIPTSARVPVYPAQERYGLIWVCLDESSRYDLPELPGLEDAEFRPGQLRTYEAWAASAPRVIMAALDDTHGPWVHEGLVGDRDHPEPPTHRVWREGGSLKVQIEMLQPNNATIDDGRGLAFQDVTLLTTVGIPNTIHFHIQGKGSARQTLIWQAVCPRRHDLTETFWGSARNFDFESPDEEAAFEHLQDTLRAQDKRIVESQRPWLLPPFWTKIEIPLRPADLPLIEYGNWLDELGITIAL